MSVALPFGASIFPRSSPLLIGKILLLLVIVLLPASAASGQDTSITDGKTPTGLTPGAPAGSYALSGFENVNLFNGNLSFRLPLLSIGGRGSAGYTMMLPIEQKWIVKKGQTNPITEITPLTPSPNWWQGIKPGYGPGVMHGRRTGYGDYPYETYCGSVANVHEVTLTRLTFTGSDGTEYELRDQLTNGTPLQVLEAHCQQTGPARGKVFVTADGSSATFISDAIIYDHKELYMIPTDRLFYPSGDLILKDGTRYRIDNGGVSWIRDRNGNQVSLGANTITDSLNRNVTITPVHSGVNYDEIGYSGFPGFAGGVRKIRVWYDSLSNLLRPGSGYSIQTYYGLFPLNSASTYSTYNPGRVSRVELPDGRQYQFYYNPYGELARVVLPTGGAFEYDWEGFASDVDEVIFRYVTERRVYLVAGGTAEHKTQYIRNEGSGVVEVKTLNAAGTTLLGRSLHYFYGDALISMIEEPSRPSAISFSPWTEGREYRTETFDIVNNEPVLKQTVEHTWQQPVAGSTWPLTQGETSWEVKANDPQITQTVTTLADANQVTKQTFSYDRYSNRTDVYEYDYGNGAAPVYPARHTHTDYLTTNVINGVSYNYDTVNPNATYPDLALTIHIRNLASGQKVYAVNPANGAETLKAQSEVKYDESTYPPLTYQTVTGWVNPGAARGLATTSRAWLDTTSTWFEAHTQYDQVGNVRAAWDAKGNLSQISYTDSFSDGIARNTYAFPTITTSPVPDPSGQYGSASAFVTMSVYDFSTGRVTSTTDANNQTTNIQYNDLLDRPTQVSRAVGTGAANQTSFGYDDVNRITTTTSDLNVLNDHGLKSQVLYDGLGRTTETRQYEGGTNYIARRQEYDALGRAYRTANPFRPWQSESPVWATTGFDALGRAISVTTPDNAVVSTAYNGNTVTVTDQNGKARKSVTDALGRLKEIYEDPSGLNYLTSYSYDALDNLTTVTQGSQTPRNFIYDSLKRLTSATNPESGTVSYLYDSNGNLTQKSDARGIMTTYGYDALNRVISKTYSDTTPRVDYYYDNVALPPGAPSFDRGLASGRMVAVTFGNSSSAGSYYGYDESGQVLRRIQQTDGVNYVAEATYNLAGAMQSETYPAAPGYTNRRIVNYAHDAAARLISLSSSATGFGSAASVSNIAYAAHGGLASETYGNAKVHKVTYNSRLQPGEIKLGTSASPTFFVALTYNYGTTDNNGNVQSISYAGGGLSYTQTFGYDQLNRLTTSQENGGTSWSQTNGYDRYGNRWIDLGGGNQSLYFNPANNRISGWSYDDAGNLLNDGSHAYTYDAENKIKTVDAVAAYAYDGEGRRVRKFIGGNLRFVYGIGGQLIAEYSGADDTLAKEYIYGAGGLVATITQVEAKTGGTLYITSDSLGTPRVVMNGPRVLSRHDYKPFGEEIFAGTGGRTTTQGYSVTDGVRQKFTQKERDNETGLDYFLARYYSSTQGRFTSPDEFTGGPDELYTFAEDASNNPTFYANLRNPQSLNKYQYAYNNPLRYADPDGHDPDPEPQDPACPCITPAQANQLGRDITSVIDKVADVTGITALADWLRPKIVSGAKSVGNVIEKIGQQGENPCNECVIQQRGSQNPNTAEAAKEGREQHKDFAEKVKAKPGWKSEPTVTDPKTGKPIKPDAISPSGRPVELKPNTTSGRAKGRRQLPGQERATGKKGRVVYYEPKRKKPEPQ